MGGDMHELDGLLATQQLHRELERLVTQRKPRGTLTPSQIVRLVTLKLVEEALEAAASIALVKGETSGLMEALRERLQLQYHDRRPDGWFGTDWASIGPVGYTLAAYKEELADVYICLATAERLLVAVTGEEWSVQDEALRKATADTLRR